jgi:predicted PurR-regulated permease PerM
MATGLSLLLDPVLVRMQRWGLPRGLAVTLTFVLFLALFVGVIAFLVPRAVTQIADLTQNLNKYGQVLELAFDKWAKDNATLLARLHLPPTLSGLWDQYQNEIIRYLQVVLQGLFISLQAGLGTLGWAVVVPIVTLYLMIDMERLRARLYHVVAPRHRAVVGDLASKVGNVFAAYLRGLILICAAFGLVVYVALGMAFALPYAVILALLAAVLYAVPYLGQLSLLVVCILVAWVTGRNLGQIVAVAVTLVAIGQIFDQLITPRVIGRTVGLHPVLGLFALMVGGQLFGLSGMVVAVPVAASLRVVLIHLFPRMGEPLPTDPKPKPAKAEPPPVKGD